MDLPEPIMIRLSPVPQLAAFGEDFFAKFEADMPEPVSFVAVSSEPHEPNRFFDSLQELFRAYWPSAPAAVMWEWMACESVHLAIELAKIPEANR